MRVSGQLAVRDGGKFGSLSLPNVNAAWKSGGPAIEHSCRRRRGLVACAQRRQRSEPEYAELDDDAGQPKFSLDNLPRASGYVLKTLQDFTERFVDLAYDIAPEGVSRSVVETTTKGALVLVTLAFASSILSFLLNAGFVALGLYVATKVFNIDIGKGFSNRELGDDTQQSSRGAPQARQRQRRSSARQKGPRQRNGDVSDVWFERPQKRGQS